MRVIITLALTFMTAFTTASAEEPPMVPIKRLSLDYATRAAVATMSRERYERGGRNVVGRTLAGVAPRYFGCTNQHYR